MISLNNEPETVINIEGLEPEESYNVTVAFVTDYGKSEPSEVVQSLGTLDSMRKTDGCIIDNDEKYITGEFVEDDIDNMIDCAKECVKNKANLGWSFEVSTKHCLIHSEPRKKTVEVTHKTTNETKTVPVSEKMFSIGWVTGTIACSQASHHRQHCPDDDIGADSTSKTFEYFIPTFLSTLKSLTVLLLNL